MIVEAIEKCENLTTLNFDGNTIGTVAAERISESLSKHKEFKRAIWKNMFTGRTKEEIPPALVCSHLFVINRVFPTIIIHEVVHDYRLILVPVSSTQMLV